MKELLKDIFIVGFIFILLLSVFLYGTYSFGKFCYNHGFSVYDDNTTPDILELDETIPGTWLNGFLNGLMGLCILVIAGFILFGFFYASSCIYEFMRGNISLFGIRREGL